LPEARLLFEIAKGEPVLASALQTTLGLDRGYLSRIIARFEKKKGWITRGQEDGDARARPISLTLVGRSTFEVIDERQRAAVASDLMKLGPVEQDDLVRALARARLLLDPSSGGPFKLRTFRTGDVGKIIARQSILYADSHGWGRGLEINEAETVAAFLRDFKPGREQCWVAEIDDVMAGAVFLTDEAEGLARLRLLHVEPFARGLGIGDALVRQCVSFARETGYSDLTLWTHTVLEPARRIYARAGFQCIATEVHHEFGEPVQGETWRLTLTPTA
jgi:DNA-binding MarR family transcriptional regulator/GNAT superfamily N-acetyltransferase